MTFSSRQLFPSLDFMDVFCVLLREDPLSRPFQVVPPQTRGGDGRLSFPGFQVSWEIRWTDSGGGGGGGDRGGYEIGNR